MKRKVKTAVGVAMLLMFSSGMVTNASQNVGGSWIGRNNNGVRETSTQLILLGTATHGVNGLAARIENRDTTQNSGWSRISRTANYPSGQTVQSGYVRSPSGARLRGTFEYRRQGNTTWTTAPTITQN